MPRSTGTHELLLDALGMYWIVLSELLGERGFEVNLVDSRQLKNAPGCKTGVLDGQWIQQLHTSGLSGAFRPDDEVGVLRSYLGQCLMLVTYRRPKAAVRVLGLLQP